MQTTLAVYVPEAQIRESLIAPAAGLLGANLRKLYRELADWLVSTGVEPAVPLGGKVQKGSGAGGSSVTDSVAKTLLTLDKLRKLLAGDFDPMATRPEFLHTMPASMSLLQDMKQVDTLVQRLEKRPPKAAAAAAPGPAQPVAAHEGATRGVRLGHLLGEEVVRLMFDNLTQDARLLPEYKVQLRTMEQSVHQLALGDSRFFSDRNHPARQFLDRITQRSLGFSSATDEGWARFIATVEEASRSLQGKPVDADGFGELLDQLQAKWTDHDGVMRQRREEAARALLHVEQRNLLAQKLGAEFMQMLEECPIQEFDSIGKVFS